MNKTITINLAGINFYIDEAAYHKLDNYLKSISASIDPRSRAETLEDIEARIAELFLERQKDNTEVITLSSVDDIIAIMGQPEDYQVDDDTTNTKSEANQRKPYKKLYRDIDHKTIAGVCAGLSHYLNISRSIVRAIFLFLLFFPALIGGDFSPTGSTLFLIYIILWIVVPAAKTTSEKLEMDGEKIDIDNIERKVREEYNTLKHKMKNSDHSGLTKAMTGLKNTLLGALKVLAITIGILIVFVAGVSLLGIILSFVTLGAISFGGLFPIPDTIGLYTHLPHWLSYILIFLLLGIPLFLLALAGLKIIRPKSKSIGLTGILVLVGIWVLSFVPFLLYPPNWNSLNSTYIRENNTLKLNITTQDTLYIKPFQKQEIPSTETGLFSYQDSTYSSAVSFTLNQTSKKPRLETQHYLQVHFIGSVNSDDIIYHTQLNGDTLFISRYASIFINRKNINHLDIKAALFLPPNTVFKIDKQLAPLFDGLSSAHYNHYLQLKNDSIRCLDCKNVHPEDSIKTKPL